MSSSWFSLEVKQGNAAEIAVRLVDKRSGKPVPDAVIFTQRVDMAPDGMAAMAAPIEALPSTEPGILSLQGAARDVRWLAPVAWRQGARRNRHARIQACVQGCTVSRKRWAGLTLAAILAAGAGGYWAGHRDLALPGLAWLHKIPWF